MRIRSEPEHRRAYYALALLRTMELVIELGPGHGLIHPRAQALAEFLWRNGVEVSTVPGHGLVISATPNRSES